MNPAMLTITLVGIGRDTPPLPGIVILIIPCVSHNFTWTDTSQKVNLIFTVNNKPQTFNPFLPEPEFSAVLSRAAGF